MNGNGHMRRASRRSVSIGAFAAAVTVMGCGATHPPRKPVTSGSASSSAESSSSSAESSSSDQAAGTQIVDLPGVGSLSYRCDTARGVEVILDARAATATESVTVEGDNGRHLRVAQLNPGPVQVTVPAAPYQTVTWRVIRSTERDTLEATVGLHFRRGENSFACTLTSWTSTVNVIGHQGKWSVPNAWP
jgi:hypothetical protein